MVVLDNILFYSRSPWFQQIMWSDWLCTHFTEVSLSEAAAWLGGLWSQTRDFPENLGSCGCTLHSIISTPSASIGCVCIPFFIVRVFVSGVQTMWYFQKREREKEIARWRERWRTNDIERDRFLYLVWNSEEVSSFRCLKYMSINGA